MKREREKSVLFRELEPVINGLGYSVVELTDRKNRHNYHVSLVIHKTGGVSLDDCRDVHKTVQARIEMLDRDADLHLEVSSPGISRILKNIEEFNYFTGERVFIYSISRSDWIAGNLVEVHEGKIELETAGQREFFPFEDIQKAKLDIIREVRK